MYFHILVILQIKRRVSDDPSDMSKLLLLTTIKLFIHISIYKYEKRLYNIFTGASTALVSRTKHSWERLDA